MGRTDNAAILDALGLGDVVFPVCLIAWGLNADACCSASDVGVATIDEVNDKSFHHREPSGKYQYASAAIAGYLSGSFLMEIVGSFSLLGNNLAVEFYAQYNVVDLVIIICPTHWHQCSVSILYLTYLHTSITIANPEGESLLLP